MADLTPVSAPIDGGRPDLGAAAVAAAGGGDTAPVGPGLFFYLNNGSGGTVTATFATPGTVKGLDVENATLVVPAGKHGILPLASVFRGANGRAAITYSAVTTVTVAVVQMGT
ncbi:MULTISPECIES: hypothetical protein [Protofrankia]|uniref:DUF4397 domain-containing protein n=1 Tax=Protofrankia coriariae TaxID=1562887 RepID=A0ABR5F4K8_9ACTN|nr:MULTISPECIES: hypothetical protein [Protofrankia]KLL11583.1 hypothetical protein FrCorBMG51_11150 [Protofrankia coriariae]ONH35719.1 hypothetical protein BL254_10545 [Protofrankia sp. BMG5.30]